MVDERFRVVATADFLSSVDPQPTSWGRLPGANALRRTVDELIAKVGGTGVWIDTGDVAQGSALAATSGGVLGFSAMTQLAPDVAVLGNHELDWGEAHLCAQAYRLPFPVLAANLDGPLWRRR